MSGVAGERANGAPELLIASASALPSKGCDGEPMPVRCWYSLVLSI
jgi:hypothetical protein